MNTLLDAFRRESLPDHAEAFRTDVRAFLATDLPPAALC